MDKIKEMLKSVEDGNYSEFRKVYIPEMQKDYDEKNKLVKNYILRRISLGLKTYI